MSELFITKTMSEKDWSQVSKPNAWDDVACERITDNGLGVYIADARQGDVNGKATIILPQWSDGTLHNPLSQERAKATAAIGGGVVIYVDNPGVEPGLPKMPGYIKQALLSGDFKPGAIKQWDAIAQGLDYVGLDFDSVSRVLGRRLELTLCRLWCIPHRKKFIWSGWTYGRRLVLIKRIIFYSLLPIL